jgi:bacterioferritin-associated ferredoxin
VLRVDGAQFLCWAEEHPPLRSLFGTLEAVRRRADGGEITVHRGTLEGEPVVTTVRRLGDGRRLVVTRLVERAVLVVGLADEQTGGGAQHISFERGDPGTRRTIMFRDEVLTGFTAEGEADVGSLVDRLLEGRPLTPAERARFAWNGVFLRRRAARNELTCVCIGVTSSEIVTLLDEGVGIEGVLQRTGAGSACGACRIKLDAIGQRR